MSGQALPTCRAVPTPSSRTIAHASTHDRRTALRSTPMLCAIARIETPPRWNRTASDVSPTPSTGRRRPTRRRVRCADTVARCTPYPVCQLVDRRAVEVVVNEPVDLGGDEKGLKAFNPPNHGAQRVLHRGGFQALRHPVDAPLPACDQRLETRGEIRERTTQGPQTGQVRAFGLFAVGCEISMTLNGGQPSEVLQ